MDFSPTQQLGWRHWRTIPIMTNRTDASFASAMATIAFALAVILTTAQGLALIEERVQHLDRDTVSRWLGVRAVHAAESAGNLPGPPDPWTRRPFGIASSVSEGSGPSSWPFAPPRPRSTPLPPHKVARPPSSRGSEQSSTAAALNLGQRLHIASVSAPSAPLLIQSQHMPITLTAGTEVEVKFGFKNESGMTWTRGKPTTALLSLENETKPSAFMASTWIDSLHAAWQDEVIVKPGALAFVTTKFRAPMQPGTTTERFVLRALNGTTYAESNIEVTIVATEVPHTILTGDLNLFGAPGSSAGTDGTDTNFIPFIQKYTTQPIMRVGIAYHEPTNNGWDPHRIRSSVPLRLTAGNGNEIITVPAGTITNIDYRPSDGTYHLYIGNDWYTVQGPVRFTPTTPALVELASYTKQLKWESGEIDNKFKGFLEVRYVPQTERLWVINELPLEDYLRGLVETSDDAPPEFHKAQAVAARTFALYYLEAGGKYKNGNFVLSATASDQVYRGEEAGLRRPRLTQAVEETHGIVATYDGDIAVTPYYAQSNGRTKSYTDVWGGKPKAWLTSVADPVCDGKRLIGHGVGMPQRCAMTLANQGWNFQAILKNYYPGITLQKVYE